MLTYSVAIRTLGTTGEKFREELRSIACQTVQPERVLVYIAEGYPRPDYTIGKEEYVWVRKGMVAQRILPYDEIASDCILMLDDDVRLTPDCAAQMLNAMEVHDAGCIGVDVLLTHELPFLQKVYAGVTNLVFPHYGRKWAFKIHRNGSFSYNNRPTAPFYWSQKCDGAISLWRKSVYHRLHLEDELWLDEFGFSYGDDTVHSHKLYKNGFRIGMLYGLCEHLDGGSASASFRKNPRRLYIRTRASFIIWWRICFALRTNSFLDKFLAAFSFSIKAVWLLFVMSGAALVLRQPKLLYLYVKGLADGWRDVHSARFRSLGNYIVG